MSLLSGFALKAQEQPKKDDKQAEAPSGTKKPAEKASQGGTTTTPNKPETPPAPQKLQLETPQEAPATTPQKPQTPPAPQKLQLEAPKEAPAAPPAPGAQKPSAGAPPQQPQPATIEEIIFRGNRRTPAATLRARIFSHRGDVYDENALERDFMALWNTGFFDDIRLEVGDGEKGKLVTFYLREKKLVRSIDYKGLSTVAQSDVLDRFKERKVGLSIQSQYDPVVVKRASVVLQQLLAEHGRQFASINPRTRNIPPNSVALTFIVVEGPKVKIGKIRFIGNKIYSTHTLVRAMKFSRSAGVPPWFYIFHKTYDKDKILADLEEHVRSLYQDHGYFFALPKEPQTKMVDTKRRWPFFFYSWGRGKRVDVTIPIEEGEQYRLGRFVIRGNKLFKQEQLKPILQLKTGDIFNLSKVRKSLENYRKLYGEFGYINFVATPDPEPDRKRRVINLGLDFEEDKQFFLHRIEFSGNTKTRDKVIRRELLLDEGNVFNKAYWDLSILRVNQLGFFEPLKKEDYDVKQNVKESTVDINVKVKEKGRNSIGFSGGVSGLAGNFVGLNYATNNFLGLGETLSFQFEVGTFQRSYTFGFTEPYLFDRPITTGFTIFKTDFRYDQARLSSLFLGKNLASQLSKSPYGQSLFQNFQQNSTGFSVFASYPLRRSMARVGLTYSFSISSLQAFSPASSAFFEAINFRGLQGPNALSGITSSTVMPTYLYNTTDDFLNPTHGKYISASLAFSGSILGGNVNTIRPTMEFKYFHPVARKRAEKPHVIAFRILTSMVSGFGGRVAPPFSRFYIGGEDDIRGFDIRSVSPIAYYPAIQQVCNRDNFGFPIYLVDKSGRQLPGTCGSSTTFPYNTVIFPGGDTMVVGNVEYRFPIAGPVTGAYFVDLGTSWILRTSQLKLQQSSLQSLHSQFPDFPTPQRLQPIGVTNFHPRSSTGLEVEVILPIVNAPFRIFYGYNWLRLDGRVKPPQELPPESLFPNQFTYEQVLPFFAPLRLRERRARLGFTVARTF